jgi:hypothetical protein
MTSTNTPAVESTRMVKRLCGKRFLLLSLLLFLLAGGILLYMIMRPISMIEAYEKIQEGMTLEQLEALIGKDKANVTLAEFAGESPHASAFQWSDDTHRLKVTLRPPSAEVRPVMRRGTKELWSRDGRTGETYLDAPHGTVYYKVIWRRRDNLSSWQQAFNMLRGRR